MAGRNVTARFSVEADVAQAKRDLEGITQQVDQLGKTTVDNVRHELEQLTASTGKLAGGYTALSQEQRQAYQQREQDAQSVERLRRSYKTLEGALEAVDVQVQHGHRSAQEAVRIQGMLAQAYGRTSVVSQQSAQAIAAGIAATRAAVVAQESAAASTRRLNGVVQQAGWQVSDFANQMANGGNVATAAGMQLGQLLGSLGPLGAALGAVVNVGGVAVGIIQKQAEAAAEAAKATDLLTAATRAGLEITESGVDKARRLRDERNDQAGASYRAAIAERELADAIAISAALSARAAMEQTKASNERYLAQGPGRFLGPAELSRIEYEQKVYEGTTKTATETAKRLDEAQQAYEKFRSSLNKTGGFSGEEIDKLRERVDGIVSSYNDATLRTVTLRQKQEELGDAVAAGILTQTQADDILQKYTKHLDENSRAAKEAEKSAKAREKAEEKLEKQILAAVKAADAKAVEEYNKVMGEGRRVYESTRTPAEKYVDTLADLRRLLSAGAIDQDTFNRAAKAADPAFQEATKTLEKYQQDVARVATDIGKDISENLWDQITGEAKAGDALDFFKNWAKRLAVEMLNQNIILPITMQIVGSMPSLFGVQAPAGAGGIAGAAQGSGGLLSNATNLVSLGRSGWQMLSGGSGLAATQAAGSFATSSLGEALGLSTSAAGVIPEAAATDLMLTSSGNALVGAAGTIGAAMPYGIAGGFLGGLAGTAMNSKVGGALVGAAAGAGAAGLGASIWGMGAVGGPWGIAAAAVISAVMAMLGTQKKTVGPNSSGNLVQDGAGGFRTDQALADNGADAGQMQQVTDSIAKAMNAVITGIGGKLTGGDGANTGLIQYFQKDNKWFVTPQVGDKAGQKTEFTDQSQAVQFYMRESLKGLIGNGSLTGVNDDVKTVLAKSNATTSEALTKHLQLAATFQDSVDAMNNAIGLEDAARKQGKTAAAELTTAIKDFRQTAADAGLDATKAANATRNWIDTLVSGADPKTYTVYEAQAAQYRAQWSSMGDVLQAVGYSAADAAKKMDEGLGNALKKLAKTLNTNLDQQINSALGRDFLNQITKVMEDEQTNARDLAAVGEPITKAQSLRAAQLDSIMKQLDATQLDVITSTYGANSDIGKLAQSIKALGTNASEKASFLADVQSRLYGVLGNSRGSELIALDAQQAKALADARAAGYDTTQLQQVQAAERAAKAFQLAQADVLGAYDQQITAQQDYITGLTNGAVKIAQSARQFRSAFDALALNDNSPLSDLERLKEARRQAAVDYATYKDTTKSDEERDAAKQDLLSMGPNLIQLARSYFGPTDSTDYKWIRSVFAEFGDTTALGVDTAESTLKTANDTLKELQKSRAEAAALGQKQYGAQTDLNSIMERSYLVYQAQLTALQKLTGTTSTTAPTTTVDRTVEQKRARLEAFSNADIESNFGGFSDIIAARSADPTFNLALWFKTFGINEVLSGARSIPGFATGTPSAPPGLAWVGEEGPELVRLAGGERIFPHDASIEMAQRFNAANDWLPAGVTSLRPRLAASDAGVGAMVSELRKFRAEARQDARAIADTVIAMMERQITALREENAELRRRIDKQSQEIRLGQAVPQYATKGR